MCKLMLLLGLGTLLLVDPVMAQTDPDVDGVGIYFDPCGCTNCVSLPNGEANAYLVITHPSATYGVLGWELELGMDGPGIVLAYHIVGAFLNAMVPPSFLVGLSEPINDPFMFPAVVCMVMDILVSDNSGPINFYIYGLEYPSLPEGGPAYADGGDPSNIIGLQQSTGGPEIPVATINGDCAVATEGASWGHVKSLYR